MEFQCSPQKVRAVGEIDLVITGKSGHSVQKIWFVRQLDVQCSQRSEASVIITTRERDAAKDTLDIMKRKKPVIWAVWSCFLMGRGHQGVPGYGILPELGVSALTMLKSLGSGGYAP